MANTYKNIVITPNRSSNTADPKVVYSGGNTTANTDITLNVYPDSNGTLSWEGSAGQLFSITNDLSNNLFGVNDVSGIPYIEVYANGLVSVSPISGNVGVRNTAPSHTMSINGDLLVNTDIDIGNTSVNAVVNSTAFFTGNVTTGTGGLLANTTRIFVGNNTINAAVNTTTLSIGGTLIANSTGPYGKTEGNLNVNSALTANNSTNLGGTAAASYQLNSTLSANVATLTANNASFLGGTAAASYQLNSTLGANIASYLPTYTGVVNGSSFTVGTAFTANSTLTNTVSLVVSTNTATIGTGTYFVSNGNIGVGTSSPAYRMHISENNGGARSQLYVTDTSVGYGVYVAGGIAYNGTVTNSPFGIIINNSERIRVDTSGNVGIGNFGPDAKLAVTGTANVSGNVTIGNATFANTFLNSSTGISNPQSLTAGILQTNASLNTLIVGPYTVSSGNSLVITSGSRLVII